METLERDGATLVGTVEELGKITGTSVIPFKCKCGTEHTKIFSLVIYKSAGFYCRKCSLINWQEKMKATCLERLGVENPSQSNLIKEQKKATCLANHGVENPFQSGEIK